MFETEPKQKKKNKKQGGLLASLLSLKSGRKKVETTKAKQYTDFINQADDHSSLDDEIIRLAPNPISIIDQELRWVSCNMAAEKLLNREQDRLQNQLFTDSLLPKDQELFISNLSKLENGRITLRLSVIAFGAVTPSVVEATVRRSSQGSHYLIYMTDVTESQSVEDHLLVQISAMNTLKSGIMIVDAKSPNLPLIFVNKGFQNITGYREEDVLCRNPRFLHGPSTCEKQLALIRECIQEGQAYQGEILNYTKSGNQFWNDLNLIPYRNSERELTHFVAVMNDVTEEKQLRSLLKHTTNQLLKSNGQLDEFVYIASHDLQEPLRSISSFLQLLERKYGSVIDDKGKEFIQYSLEGTRRMKELIGDLLTLSQAGTQEINLEPVPITEVINEIKDDFSYQLQDSNGQITHSPLPELLTDRAQIAQLFHNLVSNAIKFCEGRPPRVHITASRDKDVWTFSIADNGIGIKESDFEKIMKAFQRLYPRSRFDGSGIGLTVCRKIVERQNGRLWLQSTLGTGSKFSFSIPEITS